MFYFFHINHRIKPLHQIRCSCRSMPFTDSLVIGIPTVRRKGGSYILDTLSSVFTHIRSSDTNVIVAVFLADSDIKKRAYMSKTLISKFRSQLEDGHLVIFQYSENIYPPFKNITKTYGDSPERLIWRAKQALDFAFLWSSVKAIGTYYLHLEDDVLSSPGFISEIRKAIKKVKGYHGKWVCLEFSRLGFIGKLYRSRDLDKLASFVRTFYDRHPVDFLMRYFNNLMGQSNAILHVPSLFQHIGVNSSLEGKIQTLKDTGFMFKTQTSDKVNPPADMLTTIKQIKPYTIDLAYSKSPGFFWGKPPRAGDVVWILLEQPARIQQINITTGSETYKKDYLKGGLLEGSTHVLKYSENAKDVKCSDFIYLGAFEKGIIHLNGLTDTIKMELQCLRISVIVSQSNWLLIDDITLTINQV